LSKEQHVRELALATERAKLVQLIASRAPEALDRYADLRSHWRTDPAHTLIHRIYWDVVGQEQKIGSRVRKRKVRSGVRFMDALMRFVGDLLRARAGTETTGRIYRPTGKGDFSDAPVRYDMFMRVLDGLKALGLVEHRKGRTRYVETGFDVRVTVRGRAARFWATTKLNSDNVDDHFFPEPPASPLVPGETKGQWPSTWSSGSLRQEMPFCSQ
jgi:hypothetical protein